MKQTTDSVENQTSALKASDFRNESMFTILHKIITTIPFFFFNDIQPAPFGVTTVCILNII